MSITTQEVDQLRELSLKARDLSYSPYSKFRVGAVLLTSTGRYVQGANVENASYGATVCAERTAIVRAIMEGDNSFKAIGIASDLTDTCSPCGVCRQFLREFAQPSFPVYMFTTNGDYKTLTMEELLPMSFGPEHLR